MSLDCHFVLVRVQPSHKTFANRLAALMGRFLALPMTATFLGLLTVGCCWDGCWGARCLATLFGLVTAVILLACTVCHSGPELSSTLGSTIGDRRRHSLHDTGIACVWGTGIACDRVGRCAGRIAGAGDRSVAISWGRFGCVATTFDASTRDEAVSFRVAHSPLCFVTAACSWMHVTAWVATLAFTVSNSATVACICASSLHTSRLLKPIGGNFPKSAATKLTVIESCFRVNNDTMSFMLNNFFLGPLDRLIMRSWRSSRSAQRSYNSSLALSISVSS